MKRLLLWLCLLAGCTDPVFEASPDGGLPVLKDVCTNLDCADCLRVEVCGFCGGQGCSLGDESGPFEGICRDWSTSSCN